jgi:deoxyribose-phosphate aldolase
LGVALGLGGARGACARRQARFVKSQTGCVRVHAQMEGLAR